MALPKVFIDGSHGTTGLRIQDRLQARDDIELIKIDVADRRDIEVRRAAMSDADLAILCLPDDAAIEAAAWAEESGTKVIDASTAHRISDDWAYGLPEMDSGQRDDIRSASKVANPGCYATGVILGVRPLIENGLLSDDIPLTVHAVSGFSGGGRQMIERWEGGTPELPNLPFQSLYALESQHKHIPEMTRYSRLTYQPQFMPSVGPFITGMRIEIPLHSAVLNGVDANSIWKSLNKRYADESFIRVEAIDEALEYSEPAFDPRVCNDTNRLDIAVIPNAMGHVLLVIRLDNLGKGASGAAVQNMNLMLGMPEGKSLTV